MALPYKIAQSQEKLTLAFDRDALAALVPQALQSVMIDLTCHHPQAELAKLYRGLEAALTENGHHTVQFASAGNGNDAGTLAFEVAVTAARLVGKRVLFIDTTSGQLNMSQHLPRNTKAMPLDALLLSGRPPYEAIAHAEGTELYVATLRKRDESNLAPVSLQMVSDVLQTLRQAFDLIVLHTENILSDPFGLGITKLVDATVLIVEAEKTRAPVAKKMKALVESGGGRVIGAVLNKRRYYIPGFLYRLLYRDCDA